MSPPCLIISRQSYQLLPAKVDIFRKCAEKLALHSENNIFKAMRDFAECIESSLDISKEFENCTDHWNAPLYRNVTKIYGGRLQFSELLRHLANVQGSSQTLMQFSDEMNSIAIQWAIIRSLIYKLQKSNSDNGKSAGLRDITYRIRKAADMEESFAYKIDEYSRKSYRSQEDPNPITAYDKKFSFLFLNLEKYFNNKGFGNPVAEFTYKGDYFLTEGLPDGELWNVHEMQFKFPDVTEASFDNIACQGQRIQIPKECYEYLHLLYCAEYGSFVEKCTICCENGIQEELELEFSDWYTDPQFGDTVAWKGYFVRKATVNIRTVGRIFAKSYKFNTTREVVESIRLPDCRNMHIFAISLT